MKYIDSEKLLAEIERLIEETKSMKPAFDQFWAGQISAFKGAIKIAESLQQEQPEVDLEKEIDRFWDSCIKHKNERGGNVIWSNKLEVKVLARHFFDMGLNARKEE